jgi:glutamine cyclotransferase
MTRNLRAARATAVGALLVAGTLAACGTDAPSTTNGAPPDSTPVSTGTPVYSVTVLQSWPHDPGAYTQGLLVHEGKLYESTGQEGESSLRRVDLTTGAVQQKVDVARPHFAEGLVAFGGRLYQLTWKSGKAFVYDLATFAVRDTLEYYGEGWGLTTDGESLIMSDGTSRLRFLDPTTFAVRRTVDVVDGQSPVSQLNELEYVKGEVWANVWTSDQIVRIDPKTGKVTGWIDLSGLLPRAERTGREDVLNGIAHDAATDKLYVTGKYWPRLFEIAIKPRG